VRWVQWQENDQPSLITNWRGDQDLLAATGSGAGLPVGQLEIRGHAKLSGTETMIKLATLDSGDSLLSRLPTTRGGLYFCSASPETKYSSLAENGIVLFVVIQRAITQGQAALVSSSMRTAGIDPGYGHGSASPPIPADPTTVPHSEMKQASVDTVSGEDQTSSNVDRPWQEWQQLAGQSGLSSQYNCLSGVYRFRDKLLAVNRAASEDQPQQMADDKLKGLFSGLSFDRVDQQLEGNSPIVREIWRQILMLMALALIVESLLCLPRRRKS
jgi:hypothetical protein